MTKHERYNHSEKGRARNQRYEQSEKGKATRRNRAEIDRRYDATPNGQWRYEKRRLNQGREASGWQSK